MITAQLHAMPNLTTCAATPKTIPFRRRLSASNMAIISTTRCAPFFGSSRPRLSIDSQPGSLSHTTNDANQAQERQVALRGAVNLLRPPLQASISPCLRITRNRSPAPQRLTAPSRTARAFRLPLDSYLLTNTKFSLVLVRAHPSLTTQLPTGVAPFIIIQLRAMALHLVRTRAMLPVPLGRRALSSSNREGTVRTSGKSTCHDASESHGVEGNMESIHENIPLWLWPTYRGTRASPSGLTRVVGLSSIKMPSARIAGWGDRMHG
jgi:hypothetical protein